MLTPRQRISAGLAIAAVLVATLAAVASVSAPAAPARAAASTPSGTGKPDAAERALLHSRELWGTIDVCSPANQRDTVGVRGSMPGDGHAHDTMYMSFRLQYMTAEKHWADVASNASSGWEQVGNGGSPRQGGGSFALKPVAGRPAVTLRGVVDFQWRHGAKVLLSAVEPTSAGHKSLAGADPADFSAATCVIG
jgi:hypothetical protein